MKKQKIKTFILTTKNRKPVIVMNELVIGRTKGIKKYHKENGEKIIKCEVIY